MSTLENKQSDIILGKHPLKIIHAGYHRAGTTSLGKALEILGFGPIWHCALNSGDQNQKGLEWWMDNKIDQKIDNDTINGQILDEWLNLIQCTTIMDAPTVLYWEIFHKYYPEAKIILSLRDADDLFESGKAVWAKTFDQWWFGLLTWSIKWLHWMRYEYSERIMKERGQKAYDDKEPFVKWIKDKRVQIEEKFADKKDQLLVYDVHDGWEPLCQFLNVEIPKDTQFPFKHKRGDKEQVVESGKRKIPNVALIVGAVVVGAAVYYKYYYNTDRKITFWFNK